MNRKRMVRKMGGDSTKRSAAWEHFSQLLASFTVWQTITQSAHNVTFILTLSPMWRWLLRDVQSKERLCVPVPTRAMVNFPKELAMRLKIKKPVTSGVFCNIRHTCKSQNGSVFVPNLCPRGRSHVHLDSLCETSDTDVKLEKCARMLMRLVSCLIEVGRKTKHDVTGRWKAARSRATGKFFSWVAASKERGRGQEEERYI